MTRSDREAMAAAVAMMRADPQQCALIEDVLANRSEEEAALFAVGFCQTKNLKLRPWEAPPRDTCDGPPADRYGCPDSEVALLKRMTAAGVSRFHPDPLAALAAIEHAA
jgi:hypothetical protein